MTTASRHGAPTRRLIASYDSYEDAQRAVDTLSDRGFPVDRVAIVGSDLHLVEQVTGRLTVLIGLVFWAVSPWTVSAVLSGLIAGLVFGAFWGAVAHALTGGRRDFASIRGIQASRYEVMVNEPDAEAAVRILTGTTTASATDAPAARDDRL
jgi:hypothetical protein